MSKPQNPLKLIQQNKCDPLLCPKCLGEKKVVNHSHKGTFLNVSFIRAKTVTCPTCQGAGYVIHWHAHFVYDPSQVHGEVGIPNLPDEDDDIFGFKVKGNVR